MSVEEKAIVLIHSSGKVLYKHEWRGESISTTHGIISAEDLRKKGMIETNKGEKYLILDPVLRDRIQHMRKGARPVYEYDAGFTAMLAGVENGYRVLEAGTGSGAMTLVLSNIVGSEGSVDTFEREERFFDIAKQNLKDQANVTCTHGNLLEQKLEGEYDAVILDMQNPVDAIPLVKKHLRRGHFIAIFTPIMDDIKLLMEKFIEEGFVNVQAIGLETKELELKKYLRVKGQFSFPAFVIVARRFA